MNEKTMSLSVYLCPECKNIYKTGDNQKCPKCNITLSSLEAKRVLDPIHVTIMIICGLLFFPAALVVNNALDLPSPLNIIVVLGALIFICYLLACWATSGKCVKRLVPVDRSIQVAKKPFPVVFFGKFGQLIGIVILAIILLLLIAVFGYLGKSCN